jgi:hypothetical protein
VDWGYLLSELRPTECDGIIMRLRSWLCSNAIVLKESTKYTVLKACDLWTFSWQWDLLPIQLKAFHMERERPPAQHRKITKEEKSVYASSTELHAESPANENIYHQLLNVPINESISRTPSISPSPQKDHAFSMLETESRV